MEYVFGTQEDIEVLKTKGSEHSDLTGFHQIERSYPDQTVTDCFRVVRKLDSLEDGEGNCYDWYEIDRHYRLTDKTGPVVQQLVESTAALEDAMCEQDDANDVRISAVEDAICEIDAIISTISEGGTINEQNLG